MTHKPEGERCPVEVESERRDRFEQIGQPADVVLVGVGDDASVDSIGVLLEVGEVRDDRVDARLGLVGEHLPAVEDDHAALRLEDRAVATDVAEAAEKGNSYWRSHLEAWPPQVREHLAAFVFETGGFGAHR